MSDAGTKENGESPPLCLARTTTPIVLPSNLRPDRMRAIFAHKRKWVNGTILHYFFHEDDCAHWIDAQKEVVRWAFDTWKDVGIGLEFVETDDRTEAEVRIGFDQADGSWSWVGTDMLENDDRGRNMNYGWDLRTDWGRSTALHEIGHIIGMPHEHQNPRSGIRWNENAVYAYYAAPPNRWDRQTIHHNIIRHLPPGEIDGSDWDPRSIMHYPIAAGLIAEPEIWREGTPDNLFLSDQDIAWARAVYPEKQAMRTIGLLQVQPLPPEAGAQSDFLFEPDATRPYTLSTVGPSDCKIVLFVERNGEPRHWAADDDSGSPDNAKIRVKLVKGDRYIIRVRTHFVQPGGAGAGLIVV